MESELGVPARLVPEEHVRDEGIGSLTFEGHGVAELDEFPIGKVRSDENGRVCMDWDGVSLYTGRATFVTNENLYVTFTTRKGGAVVAPYAPPRSDEVAWYRFGTPMCSSSAVLWYRVSEGVE